MAFANDGQEKTEEATPRRKQEARRRGMIAKSADLNGAAVLLATVLAMPLAFRLLGESYIQSVRLAFGAHPSGTSPTELLTYIGAALLPAMGGLSLLLGVAMAVGLAVNWAQVGFVLSSEAMKPSWDRINPLAGFKRLFSLRASVEGIKATAKFILFGMLAWGVVSAEWRTLMGLSWLSVPAAATKLGGIAYTILLRVAVAWLVLAALDYLFQRKQMDKQLRMSRDELKREHREQEGSPEIKAAMHSRRRKLAKGRMMDRVKNADVVVTNPTHFAVAIEYDRSKMHAPMVVAKGQDYLALRIKEVAKDNRVPIIENPALARKLYKACEVGDFVPRDLFQAVAEVLAYVYSTLREVKSRR